MGKTRSCLSVIVEVAKTEGVRPPNYSIQDPQKQFAKTFRSQGERSLPCAGFPLISSLTQVGMPVRQRVAPAFLPVSGLAPAYFRDPRCGFFNCDCRILIFFRFGLLMMNVPLPKYSA
jgi:hypothetical protein